MLNNFKTLEENERKCVFNVPKDFMDIIGLGERGSKRQNCYCPYYYIHQPENNYYYKRFQNPEDCFNDTSSINSCVTSYCMNGKISDLFKMECYKYVDLQYFERSYYY